MRQPVHLDPGETGVVQHCDRQFLAPHGAEAGAATLNYGMFIQTVVDFVIIAFAIFMVIKAMNNLKKKEEAAPAPPPKPSEEVTLLQEIRDLMKKD